MSAFTGGGHGRGAMRARREIKRAEAQERDAVSAHQRDGRRRVVEGRQSLDADIAEAEARRDGWYA